MNKVEDFVIWALRAGVLVSASVILCGIVLLLVTGSSGYSGSFYPTTLPGIVEGVLTGKSIAIISAGLLLLILTPVLRVGISIISFATEKDWLYTGISGLVFLILLTSFFVK